jgi:hypothetical protein
VGVNVNQLIIDYVYFCDRRGEVLDFDGFKVVWETATAIAEETAPEDREMVLQLTRPFPVRASNISNRELAPRLKTALRRMHDRMDRFSRRHRGEQLSLRPLLGAPLNSQRA